MASSEDVRDIMGLPAQDTTITKDFEKTGAALQDTGQVLPHAGETFCL